MASQFGKFPQAPGSGSPPLDFVEREREALRRLLIQANQISMANRQVSQKEIRDGRRGRR